MAYKPTCPTLKKIADDEPMFVLRAQDQTAHLVVLYWLGLNPQISKDRKKEVKNCALAMDAWPKRKAAD